MKGKEFAPPRVCVFAAAKLESASPHLAILIQLVVGQLDLLEGDDLLPQLLPGVGRVRVGVQPPGWRRIRLARHQPRGAVVGVAVALVVARHNVQDDVVLEVRIQVDEAGPDGGEHPPARNKEDGF